jgi:hypothetical protein
MSNIVECWNQNGKPRAIEMDPNNRGFGWVHSLSSWSSYAGEMVAAAGLSANARARQDAQLLRRDLTDEHERLQRRAGMR